MRNKLQPMEAGYAQHSLVLRLCLRALAILKNRAFKITMDTIRMETIQIVLDAKLLRATDRAARRTKLNRSALIRDALRAHLRGLELRALEERDRVGYSKAADEGARAPDWESEAAWPEE